MAGRGLWWRFPNFGRVETPLFFFSALKQVESAGKRNDASGRKVLPAVSTAPVSVQLKHKRDLASVAPNCSHLNIIPATNCHLLAAVADVVMVVQPLSRAHAEERRMPEFPRLGKSALSSASLALPALPHPRGSHRLCLWKVQPAGSWICKSAIFAPPQRCCWLLLLLPCCKVEVTLTKLFGPACNQVLWAVSDCPSRCDVFLCNFVN